MQTYGHSDGNITRSLHVALFTRATHS